LHQVRHRRSLRAGARTIGLLSLDQVTVAANGATLRWQELEIELGQDGMIADLLHLRDFLQTTFLLRTESESKFVRAWRWYASEGIMP
jgi:inorganic triphosphatase YgiF